MLTTALEAFWPTVDLKLDARLSERQHFYNWEHPQGSLGDLARLDRLCDLIHHTPTGEGIAATHDPRNAFILPRDGWPAARPRRT